MEESNAFVSSEIRIAEMKLEISELEMQLFNLKQTKEPESLHSVLNAQIDDLLSRITEKSSVLLQQESELEWFQHKHPLASQIQSLKAEFRKKSQLLDKAQEKQLQEHAKMVEIQKLETVNPKIYSLVQKMLQAEQRNLKLRRAIAESEEKKKQMRIKYAEMTTAFSQEESIKAKIKEMVPLVNEKEEVVRGFTKKINITKKLTSDIIEKIESSVVKGIIRECGEVRKIREGLAEEIKSLQKEYYEHVYKIDQTEKNPEKIAPHVANQNLRQENKLFEVQITERSKEEKEKQKEKFRLEFQLENSLKELNELRIHIESLEGKQPEKNEKKFSRISTLNSEKKHVESEKTFDAQRSSVIQILGKGICDGMGEKVMRVLKSVGKPGQGLASKVLELNRSQFAQSKTLLS